jgi:CRP-like cAMP-binding protein
MNRHPTIAAAEPHPALTKPVPASARRHGPQPPEGNLLLARIPDEEQRMICRHAEIVSLEKGQVISEAERAIGYAYFPTRGLVSLQKLGADGGSIEVANVSREGMVGVPLLLGSKAATITAKVIAGGPAIRLRGDLLERLCLESPALRLGLLAYVHELFEEMAQSVHCNTLHAGLPRLCRWLLVASSRVGSDVVSLTHEALGHILGMPRTGVTRLATELHDAGAIRCRYGTITILNRRRLELSACECVISSGHLPAELGGEGPAPGYLPDRQASRASRPSSGPA